MKTARMAGYSGTPLAKKLGIVPGAVVHTIAAPNDYRDWLSPMPPEVSFATRPKNALCDIVHVFATSLAELDRTLPKARAAIKTDGAIWMSWHKKSSKIPTDVTEDEIRKRALATDLVDIKVCAVTELWSGLKLVVRKHLR
jgi:hypothetical protein